MRNPVGGDFQNFRRCGFPGRFGIGSGLHLKCKGANTCTPRVRRDLYRINWEAIGPILERPGDPAYVRGRPGTLLFAPPGTSEMV
jgi:hypothetical protein